MPKITIQVEEFTRRDGTVVSAHEREIDVPSLSGENRVKLDDFIQSIGFGTRRFNPVDTEREVRTLENIISDIVPEIDESNAVELSIAEQDELLDSLLVNDLEESSLEIPEFNEDNDGFLFQNGLDAYVHVRGRESLPDAGPFELIVLDIDDKPIGYFRGTKNGDKMSFNMVVIEEDSRGQGIGKGVYKKFLENGRQIQSDTQLTESSIGLYKSLRNDGAKISELDGRALLTLNKEPVKDPTKIAANEEDLLVDKVGTGAALSKVLGSDKANFDDIVNAIAEDSGFTKDQVGQFLVDAGVQKNDLPAASEFLGTVPIGGFAPDSENFKRWSRGYDLIEGSEINQGRTGKPFVAKVYHGTTHDFYEFNAGEEGDIEGFLGSQNYFTSDYSDASLNYTSQGADLTGRIERRKEDIESLLFDTELSQDVLDAYGIGAQELIGTEYDGFSEDEFIEQASVEEFARIVAERELKGDAEQVMELYVRADNPIFVNAFGLGRGFGDRNLESIGDNRKNEVIDNSIEIDPDEADEAWEQIKEENDLTDEDRDDWIWDIESRVREWSYAEPPIAEALNKALRENDYDSSLTYEILGDLAHEPVLTTEGLLRIRQEMGNQLYDNDRGELASSEVFAQMLFNMNYDAIILRDANQQFAGMNMGGQTAHIHLPDAHNNQIKLSDGRNTEFLDNSDIRNQISNETRTFREYIEGTEFQGKSLRDILSTAEGREKLEEYKRLWRSNLS